MSIKGIVITKENYNTLLTKYNLIDAEDYLEVGMVLVQDFGEGKPFQVLKIEVFDQFFEEGLELENGFFEVYPISGPNPVISV